MELNFEKNGDQYSVPKTEDLPAVSVAYLLNYGFQQSMQDCIAGVAKAVAVEFAEKAKKDGTQVDPSALADATKQAIAGQLGKRLDNILKGEVGIRTSVQRDPLMAIAREQVWIAIRAKEDLHKAIKALEKDAKEAKIAELAKGHLDKNRDRIQAEYDRRKAAVIDVTL